MDNADVRRDICVIEGAHKKDSRTYRGYSWEKFRLCGLHEKEQYVHNIKAYMSRHYTPLHSDAGELL